MVDAVTQITTVLESMMGLIFTGYEQQFLSVVLYTVAIMFYAIIIWNLYRLVAKQDIFVLKGMKRGDVPSWLSFLLYLVLFPVVTFVAFLFFSGLLMFLSKGQSLEEIFALSATLIASIRIIAYYEEDLARDIAKMIPLALLGVFLVDPSYYSITIVAERLASIPALVPLIARYLLLVIVIEWILRIMFKIRNFVHSPD